MPTPPAADDRCRLIEGSELVRVSHGTEVSLVEEASELLHRQWPRGGTAKEYREWYLSRRTRQPSSSEDSQPELPRSYLLTATDGRLIAHGRLTECHDDSGAGRAAAVTFVVVRPERRAQGWGSHLMDLLEAESLRLGYHYLYLWTHTAVEFYERLGYAKCDRVSLRRDCLKKLEMAQVTEMEAVLSRRLMVAVSNRRGQKARFPSAASQPSSETILLPPDGGLEAGTHDIWLRKRLVEAMDPVDISREERLDEILRHLEDRASRHPLDPLRCWKYVVAPLAWHPQVGPSCGLAAVRMVRDHLANTAPPHDDQASSMLRYAQESGMSADGEIFDANDLASIAKWCCGPDVTVQVQEFPSAQQILSTLIEDRGHVIIPYDSQPRTRLPCHNSGLSAHWGVVVGVLLGCSPASRQSNHVEIIPWAGESLTVSTAAGEALWLLVQHGLSRKLSIATWEEFRSSNAQLTTADSSKFKVRQLNLMNRSIRILSETSGDVEAQAEYSS